MKHKARAPGAEKGARGAEKGARGARFRRDRHTWQLYLLLAFYGYLLNILGPITPFLRAKLDISYTVASFHFSAFAVGIVLAGLGGNLVVDRVGQKRAVWMGCVGITGGAVLLAVGRNPALTIAAAFLMGALGSLLLVLIPAMLAEHHGERSIIAMAEANTLASLAAAGAPMLVGIFAAALGNWTLALYLSVAGLAAIGLGFRFEARPAARTSRESIPIQPARRLPGLYWGYWLMLVMAVSIEFCMIFWGAEYLISSAGLTRADAALFLSLFLWAMLVSRLAGSILVRRFTSTGLITGSLLLAGGGFLLYWQGSAPALTIGGLFLTGLGVANLYPMLVTRAIAAAPGEANLASARSAFASGTAIFSLPLLLGGLADRVGIRSAYGVVAVLIALGLAGFWAINRAGKPAVPAGEEEV